MDSLLTVWKSQQFPAAEEAVGELIVFMYNLDFKNGLAFSQRLLRETAKEENKLFYINVLIHSYRFHPFQKRSEMLNQAAELAKSENLPNLVAAAYTFKSISFRDNSMPDSAMIYALMAKDIITEIDNGASLDEINQLIADMHFYAEEYDEAEKIYAKLLELEKNFYKHWRFKTLTNNLGLIKLKQYKFDEAEKYFTAAYQKLIIPPMSPSDSIGLVYQYRKLMEVKLVKGEYKSAEEYYEKGRLLARRYFQQYDLSGLYLGYAEILRNKNKFDSAHSVLSLAEEIEKKYPDLSFRAALNRERANIYQAEGNYRRALPFLEQWVILSKTVDSVFNRARILHIYAEHNYLVAESRAEGFKRETNLISAILFLCFASLLILMAFYFRLRKSYGLLVEKNLELAYRNESLPIHHFNKSESDEEPTDAGEVNKKELDEPLLNEIITKLEKQLQVEKVYLAPELTTASTAQLIGTNRTYLSLAVRSRYGISFHDLINGYRIREATRIMNSSDAGLMTVDSIAEKAGFNNRVTFSKAFQSHTGVSPSFFLKNIQSRKKDA